MKKIVFFTGIVSLTLISWISTFYFKAQLTEITHQRDLAYHQQADLHELMKQLTSKMTDMAKHHQEEKTVLENSIKSNTASLNALQKEEQDQLKHWQIKEAKYQHDLDKLNGDIKAIRKRIKDTDSLYAQRFKLGKQLYQINEMVVKSAHQIDAHQLACDEFKQGNSWNKVSEKDCEALTNAQHSHYTLRSQYQEISTELNTINLQLQAYGHL